MAVSVAHIQVLQGVPQFSNAAEFELEAYARQHSGSIRDDGLRKVLAGKTTLEEVLRVTNEAAE